MKNNITLEQINPNDDTTRILKLNFSNEDYVNINDIIIIAETSKATLEIPTDFNGYIYYNCKQEDEMEVSSILAYIFDSLEELKKFETDNNKNQKTLNNLNETKEIKSISAKVIKMAEQIGISLKELQDNNIFNMDDFNDFIRKENKNNKEDPIKNLASNKKQITSKIKQIEINNLKDSLKNTIPCFCTVKIHNFDIEKLKLRYKLFFNNLCPYFIHICSNLLSKYKNLNGFFYNNDKFYYDNINIGFTIETDKEMSVPVIYESDKLSYDDIQNQYIEKFKKYEKNTLSLKDIDKCTFVVSDLSSVADVSMHSPIMYNYTSSIIGIALDKQSKELNLTLTYDHQMSSGKEALLFLNDIKHKIIKDIL